MQKLTKLELVRVQYIPKTLEAGRLYVSEEYGAAVHLCACGCGMKVSTPLGPTEWSFEETASGPSLSPSVGNWQFPCKSHYWISAGRIFWAEEWTDERIAAGRKAEERRRRAYYDSFDQQRAGLLQRLSRWLKSLFGS